MKFFRKKNINESINPGSADVAGNDCEKKKPLRKPLIKTFDLYIIRKFLGSYVFSIMLLLAIVVMFDINEKLDAILTAPLSETVFDYQTAY